MDCGLLPVSYSNLRFAKKKRELSQSTFRFKERNDEFFSRERSFSLAASSASAVSVNFPSIHLQDAERAALHTVNVSLDQSPDIKAKKNTFKLTVH